MNLVTEVKYKGELYIVRLDIYNPEELEKQRIGLFEPEVYVFVEVYNGELVYATKSYVSTAKENSLIEFIEDSVKAAHKKENLKQIKKVAEWNGEIEDKKGLIVKDPKGRNVLVIDHAGVVDWNDFAKAESSQINFKLKEDNSQDINLNITFNAPSTKGFNSEEFVRIVREKFNEQLQKGIK